MGSAMSIVRDSVGGSVGVGSNVGVGSSVAQALPCTPTTTNIKNAGKELEVQTYRGVRGSSDLQ